MRGIAVPMLSMGRGGGMPVTWRPKRYPITCGLNASSLARMVEVRRRERLFKASLGMVLVLFFVVVALIAILR